MERGDTNELCIGFGIKVYGVLGFNTSATARVISRR